MDEKADEALTEYAAIVGEVQKRLWEKVGRHPVCPMCGDQDWEIINAPVLVVAPVPIDGGQIVRVGAGIVCTGCQFLSVHLQPAT